MEIVWATDVPVHNMQIATCPTGYYHTYFLRASDWSFKRFYVPDAVASGYTLTVDSSLICNAFDQLHQKHGLPGVLAIPMESFTRDVEIVLKTSVIRDMPGYRPDPALWNVAVRDCGYIQSRQAASTELNTVHAQFLAMVGSTGPGRPRPEVTPKSRGQSCG